MKITQIVCRYNTEPLRQVLSHFVLFLIIVSIITLSIETLPNLSSTTKKKLDILEVAITIFFTIEYVVRIVFSQRRSKYIFSFFGILDLVAILPFYLSLGIDLRAVRAFRLFRIFRILKLAKYDVAMARLGKAFSYMKKEISIFLFTTFILLYLSAALVYFFEHPAQPEKFQSIFHSLWWAVLYAYNSRVWRRISYNNIRQDPHFYNFDAWYEYRGRAGWTHSNSIIKSYK